MASRGRQNGNITSQLECGARSIDWRPALATVDNSTELVFHHGPITVPHSMQAAAAEVVAWTQRPGANQTEDELVMLSVWDCSGGTACDDAAVAAFEAVGLPVIHGAACDAAVNWTLAETMAAAALKGGGHAVALLNCPYWSLTTYNARIGCTGFKNYSQGTQFVGTVKTCLGDASTGLLDERTGELPPLSHLLYAIEHRNAASRVDRSAVPQLVELPASLAASKVSINWPQVEACISAGLQLLDSKDQYTCYEGSDTADIPFGLLEKWNEGITAQVPPHNPNLLYWIQGAWAEHVASIAIGFLHGSTLLQDEVRSKLNARLVEWVASPDIFKYNPGGVGINAVCNGGSAILDALRARLPSEATMN